MYSVGERVGYYTVAGSTLLRYSILVDCSHTVLVLDLAVFVLVNGLCEIARCRHHGLQNGSLSQNV